MLWRMRKEGVTVKIIVPNRQLNDSAFGQVVVSGRWVGPHGRYFNAAFLIPFADKKIARAVINSREQDRIRTPVSCNKHKIDLNYR